MPSKPSLGELVVFVCHSEEGVSISADARVRLVHEDATLDLEVYASDNVTINKRRVRYGNEPGCWRERPAELVEAEEVSQ